MACFLYNLHWLFSFLLGPTEHLGLFFHTIYEADQYLDGQWRLAKSECVAIAIFLIVWLLGGVTFAWAFGAKPSSTKIIVLVLFWVCVGAANIYLFAIGSV